MNCCICKKQIIRLSNSFIFYHINYDRCTFPTNASIILINNKFIYNISYNSQDYILNFHLEQDIENQKIIFNPEYIIYNNNSFLFQEKYNLIIVDEPSIFIENFIEKMKKDIIFL